MGNSEIELTPEMEAELSDMSVSKDGDITIK